MFNKILISFFCLFFTSTAFAQLSKKEKKQLKNLKKQYEFVSLNNRYFSTPKNCDKIIVGNFSKGPSDGGGGFNKGITNLKVVTLGGDVLSQIKEYDITLPFGNDDRSYKYLIRTITPSGKVGLMDNCGNSILTPTYDHINLFNKDGLAVAFAGNSIDVINSKGKSILTEKIPYKVNYKDFWTVPTSGEITQLQVIDGKIFISDGNGKYAIYDIENKKNITDFKYTYLSTSTVQFQNKIYVKASIKPYKTLVDINSGEEVLPTDKFYDIDGTRTLEGIEYIRVIANEEPYNRNLYDPAAQKLLLPTNFKLWDVSGSVANRPNLIKLCAGVSNGCGIFDLNTNSFLLEPKENYRGIGRSIGHKKLLELNTLLIDLKDSYTFEFFDLDTNQLLELYISRKRMNLSTSSILKFADGTQFFRARITPSPTSATHYYALYDANWKEIFVSKTNTSIKYNKEGDFIEISEKNAAKEVVKVTKIGKNGELLN